jgi:hypothetical protein
LLYCRALCYKDQYICLGLLLSILYAYESNHFPLLIVSVFGCILTHIVVERKPR